MQQEQNKSLSSYSTLIQRFNDITSQYYSFLPEQSFMDAFMRAGYGLANQPDIQNARVKGISSLPLDYTKEQIGDFLRSPYYHERELRQTSEVLKWTAYPFFKIAKTYQDIPTYRNYFKPLYIDADIAKSKEFKREAMLLDKFSRTLGVEQTAHKIVGEAINQGKAFYVPRYEVDKIHNKVNYAFMQQLPTDWCRIIGFNNISGYTVSFDMMYFLQPGTDVKQYGDLFDPYIDDFANMFDYGDKSTKEKYVYSSVPKVKYKAQKELPFYVNKLNRYGRGNPQVFEQNGRWMYFVSLPIDRVWTFEIDDSTAAVASPLSGLMLTYSQQSDYEAVQLSLLTNPLIKIFTGEIEYRDDPSGSVEDNYKLSVGGRKMFEAFFDMLMQSHNTGGTAFYTAPVKNIKSHDFSESANANEVSESFNRYGMEKAGLAAIIPVTDDVKAAQIDASTKIESRFATATIYPQFERMMNHIYRTLNLKHEWCFKMFGTIFDEEDIRKNAQTAISNGDISAHFILAALDGNSWVDKLYMMQAIKESELLDMLIPPVTSYTMKQENSGLPPQSTGRPQTEDMSESKEKAIDAGITEV